MTRTPEPIAYFTSVGDLVTATRAVMAQRKRVRRILAASMLICAFSTITSIRSSTGWLDHDHCPDGSTYAVHDLETGSVHCDDTPRPTDPEEDIADA